MTELITNCVVCGHENFSLQLEAEDYTVSREYFKIVRCNHCHFLFTNPRPNQESIGSYYQSDNYLSHHSHKKDWMSWMYRKARNWSSKQKLKRISAYKKGGNLLDIGCGTGFFIDSALKKGWNTMGTEPDPAARNIAQKQSNQVIYEDIFQPEFTAQQFDVITLWHVLEHIHKLEKNLLRIRSLLKSDGFLFIAVPNHHAYDAEYYGKFWAAYDVPRHLYHFDQNSMRSLLSRFNLEIVKIFPMYLDAYYVSLWSEQFKNGRKNIINAFKIGLSSNLSAQHHGDYSSMLYVAKIIS